MKLYQEQLEKESLNNQDIKCKSKAYLELYDKIKSKEAKIAVMGMGYVGLPNIVMRAKQGFHVTGFDINSTRVDKINNGNNYILDVDSNELETLVGKGIISATNDFNLLADMDVIFVDVPTPIDEYKNPDLNYIKQVSDNICKYAKPPFLIIMESTTYPGTSYDFFVKPFEQLGLVVGEDIFVAYSPERIDPSNLDFQIHNTPRVLGEHMESSLSLAKLMMGDMTYVVGSNEVAEMTKLYENYFRFVNIAIVNEITLVCNRLNIDVWEVLNAAQTKPFGFMSFFPSVGIGGHCIPVDPYYLSWSAQKYNMHTILLDSASVINDKMCEFALDKIRSELEKFYKTLNKSKIAILGATYKKDIDDVRESCIFRVYTTLEEHGSIITIYDPYVKEVNIESKTVSIKGMNYSELHEYDLAILLVNHSCYDYDKIYENSNLIFDTKNAFNNIEDKDKKCFKL